MPYISKSDPYTAARSYLAALVTRLPAATRACSSAPSVGASVDELSRAVCLAASRGEIDGVALRLAVVAAARALDSCLGLPRGDVAQLHVLGNDWISWCRAIRPLEKRLASCPRHCRRLQHFFSDVRRGRREREPTDDLIGALVAAATTRSHRSAADDRPRNRRAASNLIVSGHVTVTRRSASR